MFVPLAVPDFLDRAEAVYGERVGLVDEPDQPADPLGSLSYDRFAELARAQAAGLDALGVEQGARVAIVSPNAGRLLVSFFGVSGSGRILVPVNFRLSTPEMEYIVGHSGAEVLLVDPELADRLADVDCKHSFVLGASSDSDLFRFGPEPRRWERDEEATATINYTNGATARPKGVRITHRSIWVNAVTFALHAGTSDRDVYLHTLPMFHANGWGMSYAMTGVGAQHVVLRKVDGTEILTRVDQYGVTVMSAAPAVVNSVLAAADEWSGEIPGKGRVRMIVAGAPPPARTIERVETDLGWEFVQIYGLTAGSTQASRQVLAGPRA